MLTKVKNPPKYFSEVFGNFLSLDFLLFFLKFKKKFKSGSDAVEAAEPVQETNVLVGHGLDLIESQNLWVTVTYATYEPKVIIQPC